MGQLSKEQKDKLDSIVTNEKLFKTLNKVLKDHGAGDLQITSFKVDANNNNVVAGPPPPDGINFNVYPPQCRHGIPMIERCNRRSGICRWVCNHSL